MKCDHAQCPGHLGKFQSCLDEALWEMSLDQCYVDGWTGDSEFNGHYSLIIFEDDYTWTIGNETDAPDKRDVAIPAGGYLVQGTNSGAVYAWRAEGETTEASITAAKAEFEQAEREYAEWSDED